MAKRRRSENRPLCISVQGHPRSNPRYASDRHTWVSYRHLIQTLVVTRTVSEIIGLEVDLLWRSVEPHDWENWTVLNYHKYIFWKVKHPSGNRRKNFSRNFYRFFTTSENVTAGVKKWPIFRGFLAVVTWFLNFFKKSRLSINRVLDRTFVPNLVQIGQETAEKRWREKKKEKKQIDGKT